MTKSIDEWAAEQCGVVIKPENDTFNFWFTYKGTEYNFPWTIKDPRCREIFRTWWIDQKSGRGVMFIRGNVTYSDPDGGISKADEESCIAEIYEAEK